MKIFNKIFIVILSLIVYGAKRNPYNILGINKKASSTLIKKAFRNLSKKYHPDTYKGTDNKYKDILWANEILSNSTLRDAYDREGEEAVNMMQSGRTPQQPPGFHNFIFQQGQNHFFFNGFPKNFQFQQKNGGDPNFFRFNGFDNFAQQNERQAPRNLKAIFPFLKKSTIFLHDEEFSLQILENYRFDLLIVLRKINSYSHSIVSDLVNMSYDLREIIKFRLLNCTNNQAFCQGFKELKQISDPCLIFLANRNKKLLFKGKINNLVRFINRNYIKPKLVNDVDSIISEFQFDEKKVKVLAFMPKTPSEFKYAIFQKSVIVTNQKKLSFIISDNANNFEKLRLNVEILKKIKNGTPVLIHTSDIHDMNTSNTEYIDFSSQDPSTIHLVLYKWLISHQSNSGIYIKPSQFSINHIQNNECSKNKNMNCVFLIGDPKKHNFGEFLQKLEGSDGIKKTKIYYLNCDKLQDFCRKLNYKIPSIVILKTKRERYLTLSKIDYNLFYDKINDSSAFNREGEKLIINEDL